MFKYAMPLALLFTLVLCLTPGCGNSDDQAERLVENAMAEDGKEAKVDIKMDGGSMTVKAKTDDGQTVSTYSSDGKSANVKAEDGSSMAFGKGAKVPEGFPKDIPIYPGAEIQMSSADPANKMFVVQALCPDAVDKVAAHYKKEMTAQGWSEGDGVVQTGYTAMHMLNFEKGEATVMVMVMAQDGKTMMTITTEQK